MSHATDARLRSPEVARRLGIGGDDVYRLIFDGELDGRPDRDGIVYVSEASVAAYASAHPAVGQSEAAESDNRSASRIPPEFPPSSAGLGVTGRDEVLHTHNPKVAGSNPAPATNVMSQDIGNPRTPGFGGCHVLRRGW